MRGYDILKNIDSNKFEVYLYEDGLRQNILSFDNIVLAEQAAKHFITEYDGYMPFEDE
jgi:hypothetical protein